MKFIKVESADTPEIATQQKAYAGQQSWEHLRPAGVPSSAGHTAPTSVQDHPATASQWAKSPKCSAAAFLNTPRKATQRISVLFSRAGYNRNLQSLPGVNTDLRHHR